MPPTSKRLWQFAGFVVLSWAAYPVVMWGLLVAEGQDGTLFWPVAVTILWAVIGTSVAASRTVRPAGLGTLVGLVLGVATSLTVVVISLSLLFNEIGS